ncbi:MAG: hypothetical protein EOL97_15265 [Spirochaetia bacterium]|nr:hypothetical protein [Spirochaetia bacterium]
MLTRNQILQEQEVLRLLDSCRNKDINCLKGSGYPAETDAHYLMKAKICKDLLNQGHRFVTEAKFANGLGRADIIDITDGLIYEVVCSEKEESLIKKKAKYPLDFEVVRVDK